MKKIIWLVLACVLFSSCNPEGRYARNVILYENDGSTDELVLQNEFLELRFFPETTEIIVTDKSTGVQWKSNPAGSDPLSDTVTRYLQRSLFSMEYKDVTGVGQTLYSIEQSIGYGNYEYGIVDGALEVNYTVGNLERIYIIPPAVNEDRMNEFLEEMDAGDRAIVRSTYRLYDIDNLRASDNRAELLTLYPDLSRRKIYVIRPDTREYQKAEFEVIFANAGYTYDDYLDDIETYPLTAGKERPAFNITYRYSLDGRSFVLEVPFDKITFRADYPMTTLALLPYMGAGGLDDEGYLLVPDGSGALIYFNNGRQNQLAYSNFIYGWDEGLIRNAIIVDNKAPFPVFGIQKNGSALVCIIEEGSSYASIRADVSGRNSSWNIVYPQFDIIHSALMNISGRSDREVYLYEKLPPAGESITLRYILCEQDGYVGMAKEYRSWLLNKFPSLNRRSAIDSVPIAVEFPGAVNKTQHRLGIPFDLPLKLTSYKEMQSMIEDFVKLGWKNVQVKLNGWFNRSVDHTIPTRINLISELGGRKDFQNLMTAARQNSYVVYPEVDFFYMRDKKPFDGFSLYSDVSRYVTRERIQRYTYSFVWFGERKQWGKLNYIARPQVSISMIGNFVTKAESYGIQNLAFRNISSRLAGDYDERQRVSREESMVMRQEKLSELDRSGTGIMLLEGHAYAAPFADFIVDIALDDQGFGITDTSVPFYQIVLHGLVPYTGRAINLAEDYTKNLLKTIESGAGLYFSFMTEETAILQETKFRQFYANEYHKWIGDADALYKRFTSDFGHLYNQAIVNHTIISPRVTVTEYEDGTRVVVNASDFAVDYNGRNINANSYIVLGQGGR
uniref:Uncharacterized protein n=1 Tax=uncultured bacterium contig00066 TaxID=1181548 RepID=A0A806KJZ2_9BACT|nr:hypothetical protein [uncultured bacterium contig00066]